MKSFFCVIIMLLPIYVFSQQKIVYQNETNESYLLKYGSATENSQLVLNDLLVATSRALGKNLTSFQPALSFHQRILVTNSGSNVESQVEWTNMNLDRDIIYRQFNISDIFYPAKVKITAELLNSKDIKLIEYSTNPVVVKKENNFFTFNYTDSVPSTSYKFIIKNKTLIYDETSRNAYAERMQAIEDYYNSASKVNNAFVELSTMNTENLELLNENYSRLSVYDQIVNEVMRLNLQEKLNLKIYDPSGLMEGTKQLQYLSNQTRTSIEKTLSILHEIYYARALEAIVNDNYFLGRQLLVKSLEANNRFAPALYQLAKIDYKEIQMDAAVLKLKDLFSLKLDPSTEKLALDLSVSIYDYYIAIASNKLDSQKYESALLAYDKILAFCNDIPGLNPTQELNDLRITARNGIYVGYINEAKKQLQKRMTVDAETYVNKALDYQKTYIIDIPDNSKALEMQKNVMQAYYQEYYILGKKDLELKKYSTAFEFLQKAEELELLYSLTKQIELPALLKKAVKPLIIEQLKQGKVLVAENKVKEARVVVLKASGLQKKYGLTQDKEINLLLTDLQSKILSQECINAENDFNVQLNQARESAGVKDYIMADRFFDSALAIVARNELCNIESSAATTEKQSFMAATTYQKQLVVVKSLLDVNSFEKAINQYLEAEKGYYQDNVKLLGLVHQPLFDFISQGKDAFLVYSIGYYIAKEQVEEAYKLLVLLQKRNYSAKYLKSNMGKIGMKLAINDKASGAVTDSKVKVLEYTSGNKWYNELKKAYLSQWKKMK